MQNEFQFTDTSRSANSFKWHLGKDSMSTQQDPVHHFAESGKKRVCQEVTNYCATDSVCQFILACDTPVAEFSYTRTSSNNTYEFTSESAGGKSYTWYFGNGFTSTKANPDFTFNEGGNYEVCMKVANACGMDSVCRKLQVPTGLGSVKKPSIRIFPNPTQAQFRIDLSNFTRHVQHLTIVNNKGQTIHEQQVGKNMPEIDAGDWSAGTYILHLITERGKVTRKLMVK